MIERNIFENISPLDHRYSLREEEFSEYVKYFSEKAIILYQAKVELALIEVLSKRNICPREAVKEVEEAIEALTVEEVYEEEKRTKHNTRALVNCIRKRVSQKTKPYIHLGVTSFDIIDTAKALRYKKATEQLILPTLLRFEKLLMEIALREKETLQIGRTHGQHAEPITFGFAMAEYVDRLGKKIEDIREAAKELRGKISGAVGAYNAISLLVSDPFEFEKEVLSILGLKPALHSTQIVPPEYFNNFIHHIISCFGVLANLSDDMRHLQRTEIGEVGEYFSENQVGSSTMPHKRNPISYENVKGLWKAFMPRMVTLYTDQISEHQRDLTNSASSRFIEEIVVGFLISVNRLIRVFEKFTVDRKNLKKNLELSSKLIIAEPLYILLAYYGHPDAHETVRKLALIAQKNRVSLWDVAKKDKDLSSYIEKFTKPQKELLSHPENYIGKAVKKTEYVVNYWKEKLNIPLKN